MQQRQTQQNSWVLGSWFVLVSALTHCVSCGWLTGPLGSAVHSLNSQCEYPVLFLHFTMSPLHLFCFISLFIFLCECRPLSSCDSRHNLQSILQPLEKGSVHCYQEHAPLYFIKDLRTYASILCSLGIFVLEVDLKITFYFHIALSSEEVKMDLYPVIKYCCF